MPTKIESILCCPLCKGALEVKAATKALCFLCRSCDREYPEIAGVLDFRICPDPYIDIPADRAKALRIADKAAEGLSFEELVAFYYSITPEVPDDLGRHYLNHHVAGVKRGEGILRRMRSYGLSRQAEPGVDLLDLGCGTGGFLAAAQAQGAACVGADVALRWLVIARSRFRDLSLDDISVVCACADHLPFMPGSFDVILAENLIEHCSDTTKVFSEIKRIRRNGGAFMARTINRFAMGPEPHVGVWGVGYLPRSLANSYVKLVKGIPYEHIYLESFGSLQQSIQSIGNLNFETKVPQITEADYAHHPQWKQQLFKIYSGLMRMPVIGAIMARLGPYVDVASKPDLSKCN
ncbi:MAG TPA: methyltransferase domain-containing protein [Drouetiella sp.]